MRTLVLTVAIACGALALPAVNGVGGAAMPPIGAVAVLDAQTAQPPAQQQPLINVEVKRGGGGAWYQNPVWVAIGVIAAVLVILLIVVAARGGGGGTTVVRG